MITIKEVSNWTPEFKDMYDIANSLFPGLGKNEEDNPIFLFTDFLGNAEHSLAQLDKEELDMIAELSKQHDGCLYLFSDQECIYGFLADDDNHLAATLMGIQLRLVVLRQCYKNERFLSDLNKMNKYFDNFDWSSFEEFYQNQGKS